jgi:multiple sugar transport system permease protein
LQLLTFGFVAPALVFFLVFVVYPCLQSILMSFTNASLETLVPGQNQFQFIGLANYIELFENSSFSHSLAILFKFSFFTTIVEVGFALFVAWVFEFVFQPPKVVRALLLLPMFVIPLVSGLTFRLLLDPSGGVIAELGQYFNFTAPDFLGDPQLAFWAVVIQDFWRMWPFVFLVLSAGLHALPREPLEAFELDGGSKLQCFFYVILPQLIPTLLVAIGLKIVESLKAFTEIYALTGGGPAESTSVVSLFIVREAFESFKLASAAAAATLFLISGIIFSIVYLKTRSYFESRGKIQA